MREVEVEVEDNDGEDISCSGAAEDNDDDDVMSIRLADAKPCASTLVVVPDVLVQQWSEQIARHVNLRVLGPYYIDRYCKKRFVPLPPAQYLSTCSIIVVSFSYVLLHVHHVHAHYHHHVHHHHHPNADDDAQTHSRRVAEIQEPHPS